MGESAAVRRAEVAALRLGIELGVALIDTAEMYGAGGAERVVGDAIHERPDAVFVVTKFYPHHASRNALPKACEASLQRLGLEAIDLYLLHWRGSVPLAETVEALERLVAAGKVRSWGVSNFDVVDMEDLLAAGGANVAANQVRLDASAAELALAWVLRQAGIAAIAKASRPEHVRRNVQASTLALGAQTLAEIDRLFPPPRRKERLKTV